MCDCDYLEDEVEELKVKVKQEADRGNEWRRLWVLKVDTVRELRAALHNTKAELSAVRHDLADTTKTLDKYRDMHVKMSRAKSELRKSVADLNETLEALTEERDLARELFQGMVSEYADLSDRYAKSCDDYKELASRFVWRNDAEHDKF